VVQYIASSAREDAVRNRYRKLVEAGKGVVYKARDLRLDGFVCIKILRAEQRKDEFRKQCFVQEAKSASFHEIDQPDLTDFIVMEFFAGQAGRLPAWVQSLLPRP
jgi:hypothetical protein